MTRGSPALGAGSNCRLEKVSVESKERKKSHAQGVLQRVVHFEDRSLVATAVAVVGRREDRDDIAFLRPAVVACQKGVPDFPSL